MPMTLEKWIAKIRTWPVERQEDAARVLEAIEQAGTTTYQLTDKERTQLQQALREVERGELATDTEVAAFKIRHAL